MIGYYDPYKAADEYDCFDTSDPYFTRRMRILSAIMLGCVGFWIGVALLIRRLLGG